MDLFKPVSDVIFKEQCFFKQNLVKKTDSSSFGKRKAQN